MFLVLPEPLDLPSGFAVQHLEEPGTYTGESFRVWDGSDLTVDDLLAGPLCRFTSRATVPDISATTASVDLARATWLTLPQRPRETASGEPPSVEGSGAPAAPDVVQTGVEIVQAVGCLAENCSGDLDDQVFEDVFGHGLRMVQALQKSVYAISRQSYTLVTQATVAFLTPVGIGQITGDRFTEPSTLTFWLANDNMLHQVPPYDLSDADLGAVAQMLQHIDRRTFGGFHWWSQHPDRGGVRRGDGGLEQEDQRCPRGLAAAVAC